MVRLLMKWLKAGVMEDGKLHETQAGTPQGGIIGPLLANLYLHYVLDLWALSWRKKQASGEMYAVRYADDGVPTNYQALGQFRRRRPCRQRTVMELPNNRNLVLIFRSSREKICKRVGARVRG